MSKSQIIPFSEEEQKLIKQKYIEWPQKHLARELGCGVMRLKGYLARNGLSIPPEVRKKHRQSTLFKKGHEAFNKGKKRHEFMTPEGIKKVEKNQFKKGNVPHNTKYDGYEFKDGYGYTLFRLAPRVYEFKHRMIYKQHFGEIKKDEIIIFKDGDMNNFNPENLKKISKTENLYRNSIQNYPEELIPTLVLKRKLEVKLNNLENGK